VLVVAAVLEVRPTLKDNENVCTGFLFFGDFALL
jgi:hypothetical protein